MNHVVHILCGPPCIDVPSKKTHYTRQGNKWLLLLQEFTFTIVIRLGKSHVIADQLSRIKSREPLEGINDDFPNAHIFHIGIFL